MTIARKFLSPWRALVAVAALAIAAAPAQAGLALFVSGAGGFNEGIVIGSNGVFSKTYGTYTITGTATESATSTSQSISLTNLSVTASAGSPTTPNTQPFLITLVGGTYFNPTGPSGIPFTIGLTTTSTPSGNVILNGSAGSNSNVISASGLGGSATSTSNVGLSSNYSLEAAVSFKAPALGETVFSSSTVTVGSISAVPEPASVVAALSGLPCVGGVLAMARRRLRRQTAAV